MAKKKISQAQLYAAYRSVFSGPDGAIVLEDLLKFGYVAASSVILGDSHGTAENEGKRRVALRIVKYARVAPEDAAVIALTVRTEDENDE